MKILLASSEVHPYSKTGGLADMVGALAKNLAREGHRVGLVTPLYAGIRERLQNIHRADLPLDFMLGNDRIRGDVWIFEPSERFTIYFIDQPDYYQRPSLYQAQGVDYPDNAERFIFLSKAVVHLAQHLAWKPELVHLHDWQVGLVPLLIRDAASRAGWGNPPRTCMTIHNLAYQGVFPAYQYPLTGLPWEYFNPDGIEFYGQFNCLKAGIAYADLLTTVSPRYAREITTPDLGCGLDGLLRKRQDRLFGVLNGVDYDEWNPEHDRFLARPYSAEDFSGKFANKTALQMELGLPADPDVPLFGSINRLVEQKGVDIQLGALEEMLGNQFQFVLLGTGAPDFEQAFLDVARRYPSNTAVRIGYNAGLSHRIEAGADFFLLPSRFEPCGLNQMYSLRYGTIPIVRATGGLDDTVIDIAESVEDANGIKFSEYSGQALAKSIRKALALYGEPELLEHYRLNGMAADFSWTQTTRHYVDLFESKT